MIKILRKTDRFLIAFWTMFTAMNCLSLLWSVGELFKTYSYISMLGVCYAIKMQVVLLAIFFVYYLAKKFKLIRVYNKIEEVDKWKN